MQERQSHFRDKRITVMGLGLLGGIGDITYLAGAGADLTVTDLKTPEELRESILTLAKYPNIKYTLGHHEASDFRDRDLIIMAPGTPLDSPYIAAARKAGVPISMWAALFARFAREKGARIIGVTGTRGKTTTTEMIAHALGAAGKKVITGGNIKGTAMLPRLAELSADALVVLELDSWKIQGFREERMSPDIGVFTTFYADHLNYYRGNPDAPHDLGEAMDLYLEDKAQIFLRQGEGDTIVLGEQAAPIVLGKYAGQMRSHVIVAHAADLPEEWKLRVPGGHNRANASCAMHALIAAGLNDQEIKRGLESFAGVPDRLEFVREIRGVKYYNDTTATTPEATIAALRALDSDGKRNIILIMGGSEKNLDMDELVKDIPLHCKEIMLLAGKGTDRVLPQFSTFGFQFSKPFESLRTALKAAQSLAQSGDIVLLSPAFASFGMFRNEYDRGERFRSLVKALA